MSKILLSALAILTALCGFGQKADHTFNPVETKFIISYLAADELKGRAVYTPEIDKAANFIADHFKKSGLKTFKGDSDYLQTFYKTNAKYLGTAALIGDKNIPEEDIVVVTSQKELTANEKSGYVFDSISASDNFFQKATAFFKGNNNTIVLVDSSLAQNFKRLSYFKDNPLTQGPSTIFLLGKHDLEKFSVSTRYQFNEAKLNNVVGVLPGKSKPDEFVIFSAHYDHIGIGQAQNGDSIYNGANDDASGTTAVMMLADYFAKLNNNERSLLFVAFTAEESGGFGSKYFSEQIDPQKVVAMINLEMVGTESKWGKNSAYITGFERSGLGEILQKNLAGSAFRFYPDPYPAQQLFFRSDNATLAALGVPAHTVSTSKMDNEPNYHKPGDEVKTLDLANMTEIIKAISISAASIISGKDTPTRVNTDNLKIN